MATRDQARHLNAGVRNFRDVATMYTHSDWAMATHHWHRCGRRQWLLCDRPIASVTENIIAIYPTVGGAFIVNLEEGDAARLFGL